MNQKVQTLKGFRDFLPKEASKRQYVINTLRSVFESYGFEPLETPSLEYESILVGKYGEEGDRLMYRFADLGGRKVAMRYDQTVPLARVVAQYQNELPMPFKRYQIQPVWRAENTQKGRYREFLQCDIDIVGTSFPMADAEILTLVYEVFKALRMKIKIKINDRSLLTKFETKVLNSIDKLKKIGKEGVIKELKKKGYANANEIINEVKSIQKSGHLTEIESTYYRMGYLQNSLEFDATMVRGLDYYTGIIIEAESLDFSVGSLGGGGRYDKLIGMFAGRDIPAVGFAFGFDRLIEAMDELKLFPQDLATTQALVTVFSPELIKESIKVAQQLRAKSINTELFLDSEKKLDNQLKYADRKGIPWVVIIGPEEKSKGYLTVKNLMEKKQTQTSLSQFLSLLKKERL